MMSGHFSSVLVNITCSLTVTTNFLMSQPVDRLLGRKETHLKVQRAQTHLNLTLSSDTPLFCCQPHSLDSYLS